MPYRPPEAKPGVVPLRPLGLGEILDGAFQTIRRHPKLTIGLAAVVAVVEQVVQLIARVATQSTASPVPSLGSGTDPFEPARRSLSGSVVGLGTTGVGTIVSAVLGALLTGMLIVIVAEAVLGRPVELRAVWARVRPRFWALLGGSLLAGLLPWVGALAGAVVGLVVGLAVGVTGGVVVGVLLGLALLVWPGVWFWTIFSLTTPGLVLERLGPIQALRRSARLVHRDFWRVLGIRALSVVIGGILSGVIALPCTIAGLVAVLSTGGGSGIAEGGPPFVLLLATALGGIVAGAVVAPFLSGVIALLYVDRRMRSEGMDIALQEAARNGIDLSAPAPSAAR